MYTNLVRPDDRKPKKTTKRIYPIWNSAQTKVTSFKRAICPKCFIPSFQIYSFFNNAPVRQLSEPPALPSPYVDLFPPCSTFAQYTLAHTRASLLGGRSYFLPLSFVSLFLLWKFLTILGWNRLCGFEGDSRLEFIAQPMIYPFLLSSSFVLCLDPTLLFLFVVVFCSPFHAWELKMMMSYPWLFCKSFCTLT